MEFVPSYNKLIKPSTEPSVTSSFLFVIPAKRGNLYSKTPPSYKTNVRALLNTNN